MQVLADVMLLRSTEPARPGLPPVFEARPHETVSQPSGFSSLLSEALKPPEPWRESSPPSAQPETAVREEPVAAGEEAEARTREMQRRPRERETSRNKADPREDALRCEEDECRRVLVRLTGEQSPIDGGAPGAGKAVSAGQAREVSGVVREVAGLVRSLKAVLQDSQKSGTEPGEKRADEARKGIQALLDLLHGVIPKPRMEAVEKAATVAETALAGVKRRETGVQPGAVTKAITEFLAEIPAVRDLVAALTPKAREGEKPEMRSTRKTHGTVHADGEQVRVREDGVRMRLDVRDQRVNDPHSLREMVRIVRRQPGEAAEPRAAGEKASPVPPPENGVMPPVSAPKAGRESSLFMQQDQSARMTQALKKTAPAEPLSNARQIVEQVVSRARVTVKSGMTEMHLQLNPRNMGRVGMHFTVNAEGELTAKLMASNDAVRQYLQDNLSGFTRDLADAGVVVAKIEVSAEGPGRQFSREGRSERPEDDWQVSAGHVSAGGADRAVEEMALRRPRGEGQLDVLA